MLFEGTWGGKKKCKPGQKEIENQRQKGFPPSKPQVLWLFLLLLCLLRAHKLNLKLKCSVKCKANKDELGIGWRSWSWPRKWVRTGLILAFMIELIWIFNKPTSACISPYFVSVFDQLRQKDFWIGFNRSSARTLSPTFRLCWFTLKSIFPPHVSGITLGASAVAFPFPFSFSPLPTFWGLGVFFFFCFLEPESFCTCPGLCA